METRTLFHSLVFLAAATAASVCCSQAPAPQLPAVPTATPGTLTRALEAARANPFDDVALDGLIALLPTIRTPEGVRLSVLEGDLLLTREELRVQLSQSAKLAAKPPVNPELIVNTVDGRPDAWDSSRKGRLTYAVQRSTFPTQWHYDQVVLAMEQAAREWQDACTDCGVRFVHQREHDADPNAEKVLFIVRYLDVAGSYIAAAFFPSTAPFRRQVNIDPSYFTTSFDRVGVLRHELGHVLGYRHEQTRGVPGCAYEDNNWKPLTPYDATSVMHYLCGNGGSASLALTEVDREGHRLHYGARATADAGMKDTADASLARREHQVVVRFEGGEVADNILDVAQILQSSGHVRTREVVVGSNQVVCTLFMEAMQFPQRLRCPEQRMLLFARALNPDAAADLRKGLKVGTTLNVPADLVLRPYSYRQSYGPGDAGKLRQDISRWHLVRSEAVPHPSEPTTKLVFEGYELRVGAPDEASRKAAVRVINALNSANIYADSTARTFENLPLNSYSPKQFISTCRAGDPNPGEADYATLLGLPAMPACSRPACADANCRPSEIYLIDRAVSANADMAAALRSRDATGLPSLDGRNACTEIGDSEVHHGTHLAGIMVSQPNKVGFIGISPYSWLENWDTSDKGMTDTVLADRIDQEADENTSKIFVFASQFPKYDPHDIEDGHLKDEKLRFRRHLAAQRIQGSKPLWITAAGQESGKRGVELTTRSPLTPMNLGDLKNVIVVTACTDCSNEGAALMPEANYSGDLVTIAAPGGAILGWANGSKLTTMQGTSQATAFVAGVAAAMQNCSPRSAVDVKRRLVLTARPAFAEGDYNKLQSGIIDADLALLPPTRTFLKRVGLPRAEVQVAAWCKPPDGGDLRLSQLFDDVGRSTTVPWSKVMRITRYPRADAGPDKWVVFHRDEDIEQVRRTLPGRLANAPLLKLADNQVVRAEDVEELLLGRKVFRVESCS